AFYLCFLGKVLAGNVSTTKQYHVVGNTILVVCDSYRFKLVRHFRYLVVFAPDQVAPLPPELIIYRFPRCIPGLRPSETLLELTAQSGLPWRLSQFWSSCPRSIVRQSQIPPRLYHALMDLSASVGRWTL